MALSWLGCAAERSDAVAKAGAVMSQPWALKGDLVLSCEPKDADVAVDDVPWGPCSALGRDQGVTLGAGTHRVTVTKDGYAPYETYCESSGTQARLSVTLRPLGQEGAKP
jgi:hypothetical protein